MKTTRLSTLARSKSNVMCVCVCVCVCICKSGNAEILCRSRHSHNNLYFFEI